METQRETSETPEDRKLFERIHAGDADARDELFLTLYSQLREIAQRRMGEQPAGHTLQPTALVHEAFMRLAGSLDACRDRPHFFATAARCMRQILVDHARRRRAGKRTAGGRRIELEDLAIAYDERAVDLLAMDDALTRLASEDPVASRLIELRFFAGQSIEDCGNLLGLSERSTYRLLRSAKAFLHAELGDAR